MTNISTPSTKPSSAAIVGPGINSAIDGGIDPAKRIGCRHVDLGREDHLVTWAEWFQRSAQALESFLASNIKNEDPSTPPAPNAARVFRVALRDGRQFAVSAVQTHTSRGRCFPNGKDPFANDDASAEGSNGRGGCDVITGYTLIGAGPDGRPTAISVPPANIASVECVLIPQNAHNRALDNKPNDTEDEAFGFAQYAQRKSRPELTEIEEPAASSSGND